MIIKNFYLEINNKKYILLIIKLKKIKIYYFDFLNINDINK